MDSSNSAQAKERLRIFRTHAFVAELPEFVGCLTMLKNWEPYILNAFDCPYSTNGFTEGVNNKIKVLKTNCFRLSHISQLSHSNSLHNQRFKGAVCSRSQLPLFLLVYCATPNY